MVFPPHHKTFQTLGLLLFFLCVASPTSMALNCAIRAALCHPKMSDSFLLAIYPRFPFTFGQVRKLLLGLIPKEAPVHASSLICAGVTFSQGQGFPLVPATFTHFHCTFHCSMVSRVSNTSLNLGAPPFCLPVDGPHWGTPVARVIFCFLAFLA